MFVTDHNPSLTHATRQVLSEVPRSQHRPYVVNGYDDTIISISIDPDIEVVHRIGRTLGDRPRSVMIKLRQYKHRQECLNSASKLRGTNVFLNEDVSKATMQISEEKLPELKVKRRQGLIAYISGSILT